MFALSAESIFLPSPEHVYKGKDGIWCSWKCTNAHHKRKEQERQKKLNAIIERRMKEQAEKQKQREGKNNKKESIKEKIERFDSDVFIEKPRNASKAVLQFDMDGNFIARHSSIIAAANSIGKRCSTLSKCLSGAYRNQTFGGYFWRFEKDFDTKSNDIEY